MSAEFQVEPIELGEPGSRAPPEMPAPPPSDAETQHSFERSSRANPNQLNNARSSSPPPSSSGAEVSSHKPILICLASTGLVFMCCGLNFAYGVYQDLYESLSHDASSPFYGASPATIDLIGTLSVSVMTMGAPFASAWAKAFSPRSVILVGGVILGLSLVLASFGTKLWHFVLSQGLLLGIGTCLSYIPAVTTAPGWYDKRRGLAMGIILSGTGLGGIVWAPALRSLNTAIGFRNTLRLSGALGWLLITAAAWVMAWDPVNEQRYRVEYTNVSRIQALYRIPLVNWRVARSRKFLAHATGGFIQAGAYYAPIYFFSSYARSLNYSAEAGANFIALSNATNAIGKVFFGYVADRLGRLNTLLVTTIFSAVAILGFWLPSTLTPSTPAEYEDTKYKALYITFVITYGMFASPYISLFPTSLVELFGAQNFASVNGFFYMLRGIGTLIGTPTAGALVTSKLQGGYESSRSYERTTIFLGTLMAGASACVFWSRLESRTLIF